jgi:hypothetical protein
MGVLAFQFLGVVLIIIGLLNEHYIIAWERRQVRKIKRFFKAVVTAAEMARAEKRGGDKPCL